MDSNQDKTNDKGAIPTPTTGTDQPTVVPTDKPVDQPAVTPDPVGTPAPTTSEPIKEEGEETPPAA